MPKATHSQNNLYPEWWDALYGTTWEKTLFHQIDEWMNEWGVSDIWSQIYAACLILMNLEIFRFAYRLVLIYWWRFTDQITFQVWACSKHQADEIVYHWSYRDVFLILKSMLCRHHVMEPHDRCTWMWHKNDKSFINFTHDYHIWL